MTDLEREYDVRSFKPAHFISDKTTMDGILKGLTFRLWRYEDLPQEIKDDIETYFDRTDPKGEKITQDEVISRYKKSHPRKVFHNIPQKNAA
ncbi:MAG: hypothetical protein EB829_03675 [Nitrosopumilus sp. H8]|nr:MAG: hypothetical protein EB830_03245 [Nitrosopumilus sp. H13]RNJ78782.1 MAG: hypothetical protein EB829_03675 [Nitrosopumilus sp. H8]